MSRVLSSGVRSVGSYSGEICAVYKKHHREPMKGAGMIGPMHKCKHCRSCLLSLSAPAMWKSKWEKQNALSLGNDGAISKFQNRNVFLFLNLILVRLLSLLCFFTEYGWGVTYGSVRDFQTHTWPQSPTSSGLPSHSSSRCPLNEATCHWDWGR